MMDFSDVLFKALIGLLVLFTCLPVHECAHAFVAYKLGDPTAKNQGRITLNPMAHLDLMGSILLVVSSIMGFGFGWAKPVQINPNNFKNRKLGMGLSALAGPVSNFLLAFIVLIILKVILYSFSESTNAVAGYFEQILSYMILLNVGLAVFNFLPIPPLDGSRIFSLFFPERVYFKIMKYERYIFVVLIALMLLNVLDPVFSFLQNGTLYILDFLTGWVDLIMKRIV